MQVGDALLRRLGQRVVGRGHVGELRVAASARQLDGVQHGGLGRPRVVRMVGVPALAGDVAAAVGEAVLVGEVMDLRTLRQRKARVVLVEDLAEQRHGLQELRRREALAADRQNVMADEGVVQGPPDVARDRLREVQATDFGAGVVGHGDDLHDGFLPLRWIVAYHPDRAAP